MFNLGPGEWIAMPFLAGLLFMRFVFPVMMFKMLYEPVRPGTRRAVLASIRGLIVS